MKKAQGFTLIELMIAMAIFAVVIAGVYVCYISQQKSYMTGENVAVMQQNIRASEAMMEKDLRLAGYSDPNLWPNPWPNPSAVGFQWANRDNFTITMDLNDNGVIEAGTTEIVSYRYNLPNRQIEYMWGQIPPPPGGVGAGWFVIADNIDALDFVYISDVATVLNPGVPGPGGAPSDVAAVDLGRITSVQITIVATGFRDEGVNYLNNRVYTNRQGVTIFQAPGDQFKRRLLTLRTQCRNLWYKM